MKRLIFISMCVLMCVTACSCGTAQTDTTATTITTAVDTKPSANDIDISGFDAGNTVLHIGDVITQDVINLIGTPESIEQAPSCHYDGNDTLYYYLGYTLYTYRDGENDILYTIELNSEDVKTSLDIAVGQSRDDVVSAYGENYESQGKFIEYSISDSAYLKFTFDDSNLVTMIEYYSK